MLHKSSRQASTSLRRSSSGGCKQLERVAGWVGAGIYAAFFTSLDRCSCVKLDTIEMQDPIVILRSKDQPLLPKPPPLLHHHNNQNPLDHDHDHDDHPLDNEDSPPPLP